MGMDDTMDSLDTPEEVYDRAYYHDKIRCFVPTCRRFRRDFPNVNFFGVPKNLKEIWCQAVDITCPIRYVYVCEAHINIEHDCFKTKSGMLRLKRTANLSLLRTYDLNLQDLHAPANTQAGPSRESSAATWQSETDSSGESQTNTSDRPESRDPLNLEQCRFCGQFSAECFNVTSEKPYLVNNRMAITLNDRRVDLDFSNKTLPQAVCRDCDEKLQDIYDFVNQVKAAQDKLINVAEENREIETLIIKTECSTPSPEEIDSKEGILDSVTLGESEFVKHAVFTHKRRNESDISEIESAKKQKTTLTKEMTDTAKKTKVTNEIEDTTEKQTTKNTNEVTTTIQNPKAVVIEFERNEMILDIKEEVIERHDNNDAQMENSLFNDTLQSELESATSAFLIDKASDQTFN